MIRYSNYVDCYEILSNFNQKIGQTFQLGSCNPDNNFYYNMRLNDNIKDKTKIHFQIVTFFTNNYKKNILEFLI